MSVKKILLVDDNPDFVEATKLVLEKPFMNGEFQPQ